MTHEETRIWLIDRLKSDNPAYRKIPTPKDEQGQKDLLRILMNVRMPSPISEEFLKTQDAYLRRESMLKGIVDVEMIEPCGSDPRLSIWQGDITRLRADAIVNAANSGMTGCYQPLHNCIDNCIHSAAGIRLRLECARIMNRQGCEEPTGQAKITPGYALPARYVVHTVGPIVGGMLTAEHERLLASCYRSCLELAEENGCKSIAFCCISTGVFMFPNRRAAEIAVETVRSRLDETGSDMKVIFNVYKDLDLDIYNELLNA